MYIVDTLLVMFYWLSKEINNFLTSLGLQHVSNDASGKVITLFSRIG